MKDPAFLFYSADFIVGTLFMSDEQVGKYIRLLCAQHQKGRITEKEMLKICGQFDPEIWSKFEEDDRGFFNRRLETEAKKRKDYSASRKNNRTKKTYQKDMNIISESYDPHMENENVNINEDEGGNENSGGGTGGGAKKSVVKVDKNRYEFLDTLIDEFKDAYQIKGLEYMILNVGKERVAVGKLLNLFKKTHPTASSQEAISSIRTFFDLCMTISDPWLSQNMSLPIIVSKINQINNILKNANKRPDNKGGATDRELANIIAKHWGKQ